MIHVSRKLFGWFLFLAFLLPFVLSATHWLNVHRGFTAAAVVGILYLIPFYILEWKVSAPLFSEPQGGTDTDPVTNKRSE